MGLMTHFAVQHIDGGVIITVTDHRDGYQLAVATPNGGTIIAFTDQYLEPLVQDAAGMIEDDI